uniref:Zinc finger HIT domain-containing protein 3 n=1 Tax=Lygus hesperus TaxID=30085 RepID=A0A0A9XE79_LYGHE
MAVKVVTCVVCSKSDDVKYKCPTCKGPYCSVQCCKEHKLTNCTKSEKISHEGSSISDAGAAVVQQRPKYIYETEDTVAIERLERLKDSRKLREMLGNPHLRQMLETIDRSGDAAALIGEAMKEPIFTEMADECLRVISGGSDVESDDD